MELKVIYVVVPLRYIVALRNSHAVKFFRQPEKAGQDAGNGKVLTQGLVRNCILLLLKLFGIKGNVPGGQVVRGEVRDSIEFSFRCGSGAGRKFLQKIDDLRSSGRHFSGERVFGIVVKANEFSRLVSKPQDLVYVVAVVERGVRALVRGPRGPGAIIGFS